MKGKENRNWSTNGGKKEIKEKVTVERKEQRQKTEGVEAKRGHGKTMRKMSKESSGEENN